MEPVNVGDVQSLEEQFENKMGFSRNADGLNLTDEQLVNFMLLCNQDYIEEDGESEDYHDEDTMGEVKVLKLGGEDARLMMDKILGHGQLRIDE